MPQQISQLLQTVHVTDPQQAGGLQLFGLRWENEDALNYSTLDDGLADKTLDITEISEGGSVPTLKVVNKADRMVFLMSGEQLIGAKQNRVLNASIMVPKKSELPIPVSCVEAGRWRYRSPKFASGGSMSHGALRKMMSRHTTESYRREGSPKSDQSEVWGEVSRKLAKMGSASPSHELEQAYADHEYRLSDTLGQLKLPQGCSGVVFAMDGEIAGADLFDKPDTLAKLWPKLVRAYALDALERSDTSKAGVTPDAVRGWLRSASEAKSETFASPGLGQSLRLQGTKVLGASLVVDEHPVHVELFVSA
jgi:hypothetical protein